MDLGRDKKIKPTKINPVVNMVGRTGEIFFFLKVKGVMGSSESASFSVAGTRHCSVMTTLVTGF